MNPTSAWIGGSIANAMNSRHLPGDDVRCIANKRGRSVTRYRCYPKLPGVENGEQPIPLMAERDELPYGWGRGFWIRSGKNPSFTSVLATARELMESFPQKEAAPQDA